MTGIACPSHLPATAPAVDDARLPDPAEAHAWADAFFRGRIAVLGLAFAILPPALAFAPAQVNGALAVVLAGILAATFGLIGQRYGSAQVAIAGSAAGMALLALGPWFGGLAGATAAIACLALALEMAAMPAGGRRIWSAPAALVLSAILIVVTAIAARGVDVAPVQAMLAALVLPLAPLLTLAGTMRAARQALVAARHSARDRTHREAVLASAADVAVIVLDRSAQVRDLSDAAVRLMGGVRMDLVGRGLIDRVLIADRPGLLKAISDAAVSDRQAELSVHVSDAPQEGRPLPPRFRRYHATVRPVATGAGEATVRLEPVQAPEASAECRAGLFSALSHEVRTPMNAILGFSEILASPALQPRTPEEVAEYAGIIHKSALGAFAVTRAVVDLLRVESADFRLEAEMLDLSEFAGSIIRTLAETSDCRLEAAPGAYAVEADARCIRMALTNIVEGFANAGLQAPVAVRLSRRGGMVALAITCAPETRNGHGAHAAYLGVVEALVRRIAGLTGWQIALASSGAALTASLSLPVADGVARLRPEAAPRALRPDTPLRKIA